MIIIATTSQKMSSRLPRYYKYGFGLTFVPLFIGNMYHLKYLATYEKYEYCIGRGLTRTGILCMWSFFALGKSLMYAYTFPMFWTYVLVQYSCFKEVHKVQTRDHLTFHDEHDYDSPYPYKDVSMYGFFRHLILGFSEFYRYLK